MKNGLIIFDLDDTLVDTSNLYWEAKDCFIRLFNKWVDYQEVDMLFEEIDTKNIVSMKYNPERYKKSMIDTYNEIKKIKNMSLEKISYKDITNCGDMIINKMPVNIDGSSELLKWANKYYITTLITRGDKWLQLKKIKHCEFDRYFEKILVVDEKNVKTYSDLVSGYNINIELVWVVGDSIKSDINPGLELGANCILYYYSHPHYIWQQEYNSLPKGYFYMTKNLLEVKDIIDNPLNYKKYNQLTF